jgi:hypothetical protein
MTEKFIAGGCSFTFGHELSDDQKGKIPSKKSWAYGLKEALSNRHNSPMDEYVCTATPGSGNSGIARRVFQEIVKYEPIQIKCVVVMWSFLSRYDWAMPRHKALEKTRWASISPWDTNAGNEEAFRKLAGSPTQRNQWMERSEMFEETGVKDFAESIYKYAANQYHETYLSWKSIIWLQNILKSKGIKFYFTLADNTLFYDQMKAHKDQDGLMTALYKEIDFTNWFSFGERMMGFNQWALLENYPRGTTHPLDQAHADAVKLMLPTFNKLIGDTQ